MSLLLRLDDHLKFTPSRSRALKLREALSAEAPARFDRSRGIWCHVGKLLRRGEVDAHSQISIILSVGMIPDFKRSLETLYI